MGETEINPLKIFNGKFSNFTWFDTD